MPLLDAANCIGSVYFIYFMESKLLKVGAAAVHVFPNLYIFEGDEIDKRSKKQKGLFWSSVAAQMEKPKKVFIPLPECTSPWVAVECLTTC